MKIIFNSSRSFRKITSPHTASLETKVKLNTSVETIEHEKAPTQLTTMGQAFLLALFGKKNPLAETKFSEDIGYTPQDEQQFEAALDSARAVPFSELPGNPGLTAQPAHSFAGINTGKTGYVEDPEDQQAITQYYDDLNAPTGEAFEAKHWLVRDTESKERVDRRLEVYEQVIAKIESKLPENRIKAFDHTAFEEDINKDRAGYELWTISKQIEETEARVQESEKALSTPGSSREEYEDLESSLKVERRTLELQRKEFATKFEEMENAVYADLDGLIHEEVERIFAKKKKNETVPQQVHADTSNIKAPKERTEAEILEEKTSIKQIIKQAITNRDLDGKIYEERPEEIVDAIVRNLVKSGSVVPEQEVVLENDTITPSLIRYYSVLAGDNTLGNFSLNEAAEASFETLVSTIAQMSEQDRKNLRLSPAQIIGLATEFYKNHSEDQITWGYSVEQHQEKLKQLTKQKDDLDGLMELLNSRSAQYQELDNLEQLAKNIIADSRLEKADKTALLDLRGEELFVRLTEVIPNKVASLISSINYNKKELEIKSTEGSGWTTDNKSLRANGDTRVYQGKRTLPGIQGVTFRLGKEEITPEDARYGGLALGRELQAFGHSEDPRMISLVTRMEEFFDRNSIDPNHLEPFKEVYLRNLEFYRGGLTSKTEDGKENIEGGFLQIQASAQQILNYIHPDNPLYISLKEAFEYVTHLRLLPSALPEALSNLNIGQLEYLNIEFKDITGLDLRSPGVFPLIHGENGLEARPGLPFFAQESIIQEGGEQSKIFIDLRPASISEAKPREIQQTGNDSVTTSPAVQHFFGKRASTNTARRREESNQTISVYDKLALGLVQEIVGLFSSDRKGQKIVLKILLKGLINPLYFSFQEKGLFIETLYPLMLEKLQINGLRRLKREQLIVEDGFFKGIKDIDQNDFQSQATKALINAILKENGGDVELTEDIKFLPQNDLRILHNRFKLLREAITNPNSNFHKINTNLNYYAHSSHLLNNLKGRITLVLDTHSQWTDWMKIYGIDDHPNIVNSLRISETNRGLVEKSDTSRSKEGYQIIKQWLEDNLASYANRPIDEVVQGLPGDVKEALQNNNHLSQFIQSHSDYTLALVTGLENRAKFHEQLEEFGEEKVTRLLNATFDPLGEENYWVLSPVLNWLKTSTDQNSYFNLFVLPKGFIEINNGQLKLNEELLSRKDPKALKNNYIYIDRFLIPAYEYMTQRGYRVPKKRSEDNPMAQLKKIQNAYASLNEEIGKKVKAIGKKENRNLSIEEISNIRYQSIIKLEKFSQFMQRRYPITSDFDLSSLTQKQQTAHAQAVTKLGNEAELRKLTEILENNEAIFTGKALEGLPNNSDSRLLKRYCNNKTLFTNFMKYLEEIIKAKIERVATLSKNS